MHSCDNPACVNHEHLALVTVAENHSDMVKKGRARGAGRGAKNHKAKLYPERVRLMRLARGCGFTYRKIGEMAGVSPESAKRAVNGTTWKHI